MTDPARNAVLIRRFYDEVFNAGNVDFASQVHGPGYRYHDITVPDGPVDHDTYMARNAGFAAAFPDRRVDIEDLIATGDRVVARAIMHATHTGRRRGVGDLRQARHVPAAWRRPAVVVRLVDQGRRQPPSPPELPLLGGGRAALSTDVARAARQPVRACRHEKSSASASCASW